MLDRSVYHGLNLGRPTEFLRAGYQIERVQLLPVDVWFSIRFGHDVQA